MKKFSKLVESVKYTEEDIEDFFLPLVDIGAKIKIYDGYYKSGTPETHTHRRGYDHFYTSLDKIGEGYHDAKLVIVDLPIKTHSVDVEPWREIQNSSGFYFQPKDDFIKYRQLINDIYGCLRHIEYEYIVELEQGRIKIILIGGPIEDNTSQLSSKNRQMYDYLYEELLKINEFFEEGTIYGAKPGKWYIEYDTQFYPSLRMAFKISSKKLMKLLSSIVSFNPKYGEWVQTNGVIDKVADIVKKIDESGFSISFENYGHRDNTYLIKITPKK